MATKILEDIKIPVRMKLSALWVSMMFLYVYADVLSFYRPGELGKIMQGKIGPFEVSELTLLTASVVVIIPALMVFLSLALKPAVNRWANIAAGALFTLVNVSNLIGESWAYYILFGLLEIAITLLIIRLAWQWPVKADSTA